MAEESNNIEKNIDENLRDGMSEKDYRKLKVRLEDIQRRKKGKIPLGLGLISSILCSFMLFMIFADTLLYENSGFVVLISILGGVGLGVVVVLYLFMLLEMRESVIRRRILEYEAENIQSEVQEDIFENSIKMSYKYLDQYYLQTRTQAQNGFYITVGVSVSGAILIGIGIVALFMEKIGPSYITCASGLITEFIAAIFFYLYNKTIISMSKYHNKLVLSHNISIALKVADTLPEEDKAKSKNLIISQLLKDINSYLIKNDLYDEIREKNSHQKES